ncbi:MAG TPA: hypothetical protein PKE31_09845 [Pseudomonadota bacterium]|nr:hypothetical protein [Pseudomonadota bacterium]
MFTNTQFKHVSFTKAFAFAAIAFFGCDAQQQATVKPKVTVVSKTPNALSPASLLSIQGTYGASCLDRSGVWEIGLNGYSQTNPPLSVIKDNLSCTLSITAILAGSPLFPTSYEMAAPLTLGASFVNQGLAFSIGGVGPVEFYGNFRIQPDLTFSTDFNIDMVYSDDSSMVSASKSATYSVQNSSATASAVPPSDYVLDLTGLVVQQNASNIVQAAGGVIQLTDGLVPGSQYVVDMDTLTGAPSFAELDAVFVAGTPTDIVGANPTVPAAALNLVGLDLTAAPHRSIVIAHTISGTRAYQVFRVTFNP